MDKITLKNTLHHTTTILPNEFIDHYMIRADGEYVKIYLLILRLMNQNLPIQVDQLADTLELTRKDILRALKYWEKEGLLVMEDESAQETAQGESGGSDTIMDRTGADRTLQIPAGAGGSDSCPTLPQVPEKKSRNISEIERSIKGTDLEQTLYMAETYLGRPLSASEIKQFSVTSPTPCIFHPNFWSTSSSIASAEAKRACAIWRASPSTGSSRGSTPSGRRDRNPASTHKMYFL